MIRLARLTGDVHAIGVVTQVIAVVPAGVAQVDPAGEAQQAVDHHELLVMATGNARMGVPLEADARVFGGELLSLLGLAIVRVHGAVVPGQNVHLEFGSFVAQRTQELEQLDGACGLLGVATAQQPNAALELPAADHDVTTSLLDGTIQRPIILASVDQQATLQHGSRDEGIVRHTDDRLH